MPTPHVHSADFPEGYRLTAVGQSLIIEATGNHPAPLRLRGEQLACFGLHITGGSHTPATAHPRKLELIPLRQLLFGLGILIAAFVMILLVPAILTGR